MTLPYEPTRRYTVEQYLELEADRPQEKYEYRDGLIINMREALAMAGGSAEHSLIAMNAGGELRARLKDGGNCRVFGSDLRVLIPRKTLYTYPDITIVCGESKTEPHLRAGLTLSNPRVLVEVLSPSTELYDRGEKFALYREIPSLVEYVLISQSHRRIETYFRHEDGGWFFNVAEGLESAAKLLSLKIELPLAEVFAGVEFPPQ